MLDDFREWLSDNLRYILLGLAALLLIVIGFCVVRLVVGGKKDNGPSESKPAVVETEKKDEPQAGTETAQTNAGTADTTGSAGNAGGELIKDDSAVLTVVKQYYGALAEKDVDTLSKIVSPWNEDVQESILNKTVTESYSNISVYSKNGLTEGSYVVYAYYDGKIANIDTLVPSLSLLYLEKDAAGKLVVRTDHDSDKDVTDYITRVSSDADVQELVSTVKRQYEAALTQDPALQSYIAAIDGQSAQQPQETAETEPQERVMTASYDVNIRETASTSAAILGVATVGTEVTVLTDADSEGWCKVHYESAAYGSIDGYCMMQYLAPSSNGEA